MTTHPSSPTYILTTSPTRISATMTATPIPITSSFLEISLLPTLVVTRRGVKFQLFLHLLNLGILHGHFIPPVLMLKSHGNLGDTKGDVGRGTEKASTEDMLESCLGQSHLRAKTVGGWEREGGPGNNEFNQKKGTLMGIDWLWAHGDDGGSQREGASSIPPTIFIVILHHTLRERRSINPVYSSLLLYNNITYLLPIHASSSSLSSSSNPH